jgi:hypothetical protein
MPIQVLNSARDDFIPGGNVNASDQIWGSLYNQLSNDNLLRTYNVMLNENGEIVDRDPQQAATTLTHSSGGLPNIWVDYCGWPMWNRTGWSEALNGGGQRFIDFVRAMNPLLVLASKPVQDPWSWKTVIRRTDTLAFDPPNGTRYPYGRGLSVNVDLKSAPWADDLRGSGGYWINDQAPLAVGESWLGISQNTYSCFAIRSGAGFYFYAYSEFGGGVDPTTYAQFIHGVINAYKTGQISLPTGPVYGPPFIPGPIEGPPSPPAPDPSPPSSPPSDPSPQPPANPGPPGWWSSLPTSQKAIIIGGSVCLIGGAAYLVHQQSRSDADGEES